jgi:hypothetical protein
MTFRVKLFVFLKSEFFIVIRNISGDKHFHEIEEKFFRFSLCPVRSHIWCEAGRTLWNNVKNI